MAAGDVIAEYGTDYVRTRVVELGNGGFAWLRSPGAARSAPPPPPTRPVAEAVRSANTRGAAFALPYREDNALCYEVPGPVSAARLVTSTDSAARELLQAGMRQLGRSLARVHSVPLPEGVTAHPPGLQNLARWLDTGTGPRHASSLHALLRSRLGDQRLFRLRQWCFPSGEPVLLHGGPGLGRYVVAADPADGRLLVEEAMVRGPAICDLGWVLGELTELRLAAERGLGSARQVDYVGPARELLVGYGGLVDPEMTGRIAVARICAHTHDFAAYVGWHEDVRSYVDLVAELVDRGGAATLAPMMSGE